MFAFYFECWQKKYWCYRSRQWQESKVLDKTEVAWFLTIWFSLKTNYFDNKAISLQIYSHLIYKYLFKRNEVDLLAIYVNIAQDCELFKAKKGYTRQFFQSYSR